MYCRELIRDFVAARSGLLKEPVAVTRARRWVLFGIVLTVLCIPAVAMAAVLHLRRPIIYALLGVAVFGIAISAVASVVLGACEATARRTNPTGR